MVDTVNAQTILDGTRRVVMHFTSESDGTGESAVVKIDPALLTPPCNRLSIDRISYGTIGMAVMIYFDGAVDRPIFTVPPDHTENLCFENFGGYPPPADLAAGTGKILFSTVGHTAGDKYTITIEASKKYAAAVP